MLSKRKNTTLKKAITLIVVTLLISCGSSEQVIMDDGTVYEIKKDHFFKNGNDVTNELSEEKKQAIKGTLDQRFEAQRLAENQKEELKKEQSKIEKEMEAAKEKQAAIEANRKQLESRMQAKEDARKDVLKAQERLLDKKEQYEKLKRKGKLSPQDEEKWNVLFVDLEAELNKANEVYSKLK